MTGDPGGPTAIGGILARLAERWGMQSPMESARLFSAWDEIVGPDFAAKCRPTSLKDGVLKVRTTSGAWAFELKYLGPKIIQRLNEDLGKQVVVQIKAWVADPKGPQ